MAAPVLWGASLTPGLLAASALGLWLMSRRRPSAPLGAPLDSAHSAGALVLALTVSPLPGVARAALGSRPGALDRISPWLLAGACAAAPWNDVTTGLVVAALCRARRADPRGSRSGHQTVGCPL